MLRRQLSKLKHWLYKERDSTSLWVVDLPEPSTLSENMRRRIFRAEDITTPILWAAFGTVGVIFLIFLLPPIIFAAIVIVAGSIGVAFSLWFSRRTYFNSIYLKTKMEQVDWSKYYQIRSLGGFLKGFTIYVLVLIVSITLIVILGSGNMRGLLVSIPSLVLSYLVVYSLTLWR